MWTPRSRSLTARQARTPCHWRPRRLRSNRYNQQQRSRSAHSENQLASGNCPSGLLYSAKIRYFSKVPPVETRQERSSQGFCNSAAQSDLTRSLTGAIAVPAGRASLGCSPVTFLLSHFCPLSAPFPTPACGTVVALVATALARSTTNQTPCYPAKANS